MPGIDHVGEGAELYALGALDETAAARVERHVRECVPCARRVGEAEATILRLIPAGTAVPLGRMPHFQAPFFRAGWAAAVAAALLIGLLPWGWSRLHPAAATPPAAQAETAMLLGHFAHAPLVARAPGEPRGKVIYALRGGWIYVLVGNGGALDVATVRNGARHIVASMPADSATRSVFVRMHGRIDAVDLLENGRPVATASIVYAPPPAR